MFEAIWSGAIAWWSTVPPEFVFLLALPFGVAAVGVAALGLPSAAGTEDQGPRPPVPVPGRAP